MRKLSPVFGMVAVFALVFSGCGESDPVAETSGAAAPDANYVLASEPAGATGVGHARQDASDGQQVTLTGRIGGSPKPFVDDVAAFEIVDPKVPHCAPDEGCPTPWDYCCTLDQVKENNALVKVVDEQGRPVMKDARELLGVKELSTVVVQGEAERDEAGNLTVLANKVFVK